MTDDSVIEVRTRNWDGKFAALCIEYAKDVATGMHKALVGIHDDHATQAKAWMREIMEWNPTDVDAQPSQGALTQLNGYIEQFAEMGSGMAVAWLSMSINAESLLGASHEAMQHGKKRMLTAEDAE